MGLKHNQDAVTVSCTTATATSSALAVGVYEVDNDGTADVYIKQGGSAVTAVISTSGRLPAGACTTMEVGDSSDAYLAGITAAGTSTLRIKRIG